MAKVKVVNNNLDQNLNGVNFNNIASETIFSFGSFSVTSNFDNRKYIDYTNTLSSFVRTVTLDSMGVNDVQSTIINYYNTNAVLNLDKSDLNTFIRFGSAYEFLRISVEKIINNYPASLYVSSQVSRGNNVTYTDYYYDIVSDTTTFKIPVNNIVNTYGLVYNYGNLSYSGNSNLYENGELKNLNVSYNDYIVWSSEAPEKNTCTVIGYTGNTSKNPTAANYNNVLVKVNGDPFSFIVSGTSAPVDFHIKPNNLIFEEFRSLLTNYEKYILSERVSVGSSGFKFTLKDPTLLNNGTIEYSNTSLLWTTSDNYNIDINTPSYQKFLEILLTIGAKYDKIKTDLIARFLTPASIKQYDLTEEGKMTKLLKIYGMEFDQLREFIDSLVYINKVTYNKINNIPDQLVRNMSRTFGWDYFSLVNENELVESFLTIDEDERNLNTDLLPAEIDVELWRRILMNTSYFWKSKGTREAIKSMFLLIGIPEPFINITEYVYTVDGRIDPNTVGLTLDDFPSASLPYDNSGYPVAPIETSDFYFQLSGNTDSGQAYMDNFRLAGFNLKRVVDNKKSWIQTGATVRVDDTTPQYYQVDSKLVLNTKEVDVALDTARGIEFDVFDYIKYGDFPANSSGYTLPFSYVNISLAVSGAQTTFPLPAAYGSDKVQGDLEVRYNGILLNAPKTGTTTGITSQADYTIDEISKTFTLVGGTAYNNASRRDVIQATFVYSGGTQPVSGVSIQYVVTRVKADLNGTVVPLPSYPRGDVQVTINGIALTKGTPQFSADYILDPSNTTGSSRIIISNPDVITFLYANPDVQIAYVNVVGSNDISARSEIQRVDSFNTGKIYYNSSANKYVYKLNYKANSATEIKVLVDGIALEPNTDYSINVQNKYEVFLPKGLSYGSIISVYYLVANNEYFTPVVSDSFGIGDISDLSFLEFLELMQRRMINARTRKTITNFKGGWYPALLDVYIQYLKRGTLPENDPLHSNGYTFKNLYPFLSKYNAFFQKFVDQLLSATIILKQGGLLVRNTIFTKQKFWYKRGVNVPSNGRILLQYFGDGGSQFLVDQNYDQPAPPAATLPILTTGNPQFITQNDAIIFNSNVTSDGGSAVTERGVVWGELSEPLYSGNKTFEGGGTGLYTSAISSLTEGTLYYVRAYALNGIGIAYGDEKQFTTQAAPVVPTIQTKEYTSVSTTSLTGAGGKNILPTGTYTTIDLYFIQYKKTLPTTNPWSQTSPSFGAPASDSFIINFGGLASDTDYDYRAVMVIGGTSYYGNKLTVHTTAITPVPPTVTTNTITSITTTTATGGGNVTSSGTATVTERGIVWGLSTNPTTSGNKITAGSGTGSFTASPITGLSPDTTYHVRAYAISSAGTSYGIDRSFTTTSSPVQVYFDDPTGSNLEAQATVNFINLGTKTVNVTFSYTIEAWADVIGIVDASNANTKLQISLNGGTTWTTIESALAFAHSSSGADAFDNQIKTGTYTATGIDSGDDVMIRGTYDHDTTRTGKGGDVSVKITTITANTGTAEVICDNKFFGSDYGNSNTSCDL